MIRIRFTPLPEGLRALAGHDDEGNLVITVSTVLPAADRRAAVREARRAARDRGWLPGVIPVPAAIAQALRRPAAHPAWAWATAAGTAAVTAAVVISAPGVVASRVPGRSAARVAEVPHARRRMPPGHGGPGGTITRPGMIRVPDPRPQPPPSSPLPGLPVPLPSLPLPAASLPLPLPTVPPLPLPSLPSPSACVTVLAASACLHGAA